MFSCDQQLDKWCCPSMFHALVPSSFSTFVRSPFCQRILHFALSGTSTILSNLMWRSRSEFDPSFAVVVLTSRPQMLVMVLTSVGALSSSLGVPGKNICLMWQNPTPSRCSMKWVWVDGGPTIFYFREVKVSTVQLCPAYNTDHHHQKLWTTP